MVQVPQKLKPERKRQCLLRTSVLACPAALVLLILLLAEHQKPMLVTMGTQTQTERRAGRGMTSYLSFLEDVLQPRWTEAMVVSRRNWTVAVSTMIQTSTPVTPQEVHKVHYLQRRGQNRTLELFPDTYGSFQSLTNRVLRFSCCGPPTLPSEMGPPAADESGFKSNDGLRHWTDREASCSAAHWSRTQNLRTSHARPSFQHFLQETNVQVG